MITIVDYGMGNLRNVQRGLAEVGYESRISPDPTIIGAADKIILPGVGAFGEAMKRITDLKLREPILDQVAGRTPLLGICLGMQLLFEESEESPGIRGLCLLKGKVVKFLPGLKVPHVGWNDVASHRQSPLLDSQKAETFYFVHSFFAPVGGDTVGETDYGVTFSAAVQRGSVYGVQFHPEKSQHAGLSLLRRFASL